MSRIDLIVPFAEKDEAKRLGARWDNEHRLWYVPEGVNLSAFERWLPKSPTVRSNRYFIAQSACRCWNCREKTKVFGFILPSGHETFEPYEDGRGEWHRHDDLTIVYYVTDLFPSVASRINSFSKRYRLDFSKTTQSSYWMNHCEYCGAKQGDFHMYCEPGGAFSPTDEHSASGIVLHEFAEPFGCCAGTVYSDMDFFFECMQKNRHLE